MMPIVLLHNPVHQLLCFRAWNQHAAVYLDFSVVEFGFADDVLDGLVVLNPLQVAGEIIGGGNLIL